MITVLIQKKLLEVLPSFIKECKLSNKPKLKLDVAFFFLSLFNSIPVLYRIFEKGDYIIGEDEYMDEKDRAGNREGR